MNWACPYAIGVFRVLPVLEYSKKAAEVGVGSTGVLKNARQLGVVLQNQRKLYWTGGLTTTSFTPARLEYWESHGKALSRVRQHFLEYQSRYHRPVDPIQHVRRSTNVSPADQRSDYYSKSHTTIGRSTTPKIYNIEEYQKLRSTTEYRQRPPLRAITNGPRSKSLGQGPIVLVIVWNKLDALHG